MTHSFRETMKDLKFKEKLSGLGGVDSIICESRKEDWKTIDKIPESFPITHSAERAQSVYINNSYTKKMVKLKRNKEITRNAMDWLENTHFIWPTLHTYRPFCISMFWAGFSKYSVQLILWVLERKTDYHWRTHKNRQKKTKNVQLLLREEKGLPLTQVSGANDKSGTSNDGNQARRFFSLNSVDAIVACVPIKYKET